MRYWFGKRIKATKHVPTADAKILIAQGWVPIAFSGFGDSVETVMLARF